MHFILAGVVSVAAVIGSVLGLGIALITAVLLYKSTLNILTGSSDIIRQLPRPSRYPIIGHLGKFKPGAAHEYIFKITRELGESKNLGLWFLVEPVVIVNDPHDVQFMLGKGQHNFTKADAYHQMLDWAIKHNMLITDGEEWQEQRKTFNPQFHFNEVKYIQDKVWDETQLFCQLADDAIKSEGGKMDVSLRFECLTLNVLGVLGFNFYFNAQRESLYRDVMRSIMIHCANRAFDPAWLFRPWEIVKSRRNKAKLEAAITPIYDERKTGKGKKGGDDLLAKMLQAEESGANWMTKFTKGDPWPQYRDQMALFLFAGSDTTSSLLSSTCYLLARHPDKLKKVQKELDEKIDPVKQPGSQECMHLPYLQSCIKETLRVRPSISMVGRRAFHDLQLPSGLRVTSRVNCICPILNLHRNRKIWGDDADEFRPERWLTEDGEMETKQPHKDESLSINEVYIPFAAGQRTCIGQNLARLEAAIGLAVILRRFEFSIPPELENKEPLYETAITMGYTNGLPMLVKRRVDRWKHDESINY